MLSYNNPFSIKKLKQGMKRLFPLVLLGLLACIPPVGMDGRSIPECTGEAGTHFLHDTGIKRGCGGMVEVDPAHEDQYTRRGRGCQLT